MKKKKKKNKKYLNQLLIQLNLNRLLNQPVCLIIIIILFFYEFFFMLTQYSLFNSNELLSMRDLPSWNKYWFENFIIEGLTGDRTQDLSILSLTL